MGHSKGLLFRVGRGLADASACYWTCLVCDIVCNTNPSIFHFNENCKSCNHQRNQYGFISRCVYSCICLSQLSINGDKEFLDNIDKVSPYPLTPVIAVAISQSDEGQEAGPLPVKVDLDKTILWDANWFGPLFIDVEQFPVLSQSLFYCQEDKKRKPHTHTEKTCTASFICFCFHGFVLLEL